MDTITTHLTNRESDYGQFGSWVGSYADSRKDTQNSSDSCEKCAGYMTTHRLAPNRKKT